MCPRGSSRRAIPAGCFVIYADGDTLFRGIDLAYEKSWRRFCRSVPVLSVPVCAACPDVVVTSPKPRSGW